VDDVRARELMGALGELLRYPGSGLAEAARRAAGLASGTRGGAALEGFAREAAGRDPASLEELYTATFDLDPACVPYVGHQLLGESPVRGALLAELMGVYARAGWAPREELGDHVAEVLAFLAVGPDGAERDDLVRDGLLPALEKMLEALTDRENPYRGLLEAARGAASAWASPRAGGGAAAARAGGGASGGPGGDPAAGGSPGDVPAAREVRR